MSFSSVNFPSVVVRRIIHHYLGPEYGYMKKWTSVSPILTVNRLWRDEYIRIASKTVFIKSKPDVRTTTENMLYNTQADSWKFTNIGYVAQLGYTDKTKAIRIDACVGRRVQKQIISLVNDQAIQNYIKNYNWSNVESLVVILGIDNEYDYFDNSVLQVGDYNQMIAKFARLLHENLPNVKELILEGCDSSLGSDTFGKELVRLFGCNLKKLDCPYSEPVRGLAGTDELQSLRVGICTDIRQNSQINSFDVSMLRTLSIGINEHFNWDCFSCDEHPEILVFPKLTDLTLDYAWDPNLPEATFHLRHVEFPKLQKLTLDLGCVSNLKRIFTHGLYSWPNTTSLCLRKIGKLKEMANNSDTSVERFVESLASNIVQSLPRITSLTILDNEMNEENEHLTGLLVANYQHQLKTLYSKVAILIDQPIIFTNVDSLAINMKIPKAGCLIRKCAHHLQSIKLFNAPSGFSWGIIYDGRESTNNVIEFSNLKSMHVQFSEFGMVWAHDISTFIQGYKLKDKYATINCPKLTEISLENSMIHTMKNVLSFGTTPWTKVNTLEIILHAGIYAQTNGASALESNLYNSLVEYRKSIVRYMPNIKRLKIVGGKPAFVAKFSQAMIQSYPHQLNHIECDHSLPPSCLANSRCKSLDIRLDSNYRIAHGSINTSHLEVLNMLVPSTLFFWKIFEGVQRIDMASLREIIVCSSARNAYRQLNQNIVGCVDSDAANVDIYMRHVDHMLVDLELKGKEINNATFHIDTAHNIELNGNVLNLPLLSNLGKTRIRYLTLRPMLETIMDLERFYEFTNSWLGGGANIGYASLILSYVETGFGIDVDRIDWCNLSELFVGKDIEKDWVSRIVNKYPLLKVKYY